MTIRSDTGQHLQFLRCFCHCECVKCVRGEREALLARREFLQQLSLWEEDIKIPLPGGNGDVDELGREEEELDGDIDIFSGMLSE